MQRRPLTQIKPLLIERSNNKNNNLLNGQSCKGIDLEFYQCSNAECAHLVYHRQGWLDRLHKKRQIHYNHSKIVTQKSAENNKLNLKYSGIGVILKAHIYRKRRPIILGLEVTNGIISKNMIALLP